MARTILGTHMPKRKRPQAMRRLYPLESSGSPVGGAAGGLDLFQLS